MVMVNGIAIFAADLKFVYPHLPYVKAKPVSWRNAVHNYAVQVDDHITKAIHCNDWELKIIYAMYSIR